MNESLPACHPYHPPIVAGEQGESNDPQEVVSPESAGCCLDPLTIRIVESSSWGCASVASLRSMDAFISGQLFAILGNVLRPTFQANSTRLVILLVPAVRADDCSGTTRFFEPPQDEFIHRLRVRQG
jgi:hypothetical protein